MWVVGFGIINITWSGIFTGSTAGYLVSIFLTHDVNRKMLAVNKLKNQKEKREVLDVLRKEADLYLKIVLQAFFALAASIGVSMTILFKQGEAAWKNIEYQISAAAMVTALVLVAFGMLFIFVRPYIEIIDEISKSIMSSFDKT
jgi:hypothetical protein